MKELKLQFPARKNRSLEDRLKDRAERMAFAGKHIIYTSWDHIFKNKMLGSTYYTALNNRACILIYFSKQAFPKKILEEIISIGRPLFMYMAAFMKGPSPILRCHIAFPDKPHDLATLYYMESPLDIRDANIQDFCQAILSDEYIDIIVKHQLQENGFYSYTYNGSGIMPILKNELQLILENFKPNTTDADFRNSVKMMEKKFPEITDGLDLAKMVHLRLVGRAQNGTIYKTF